jgi:hypothetical protein
VCGLGRVCGWAGVGVVCVRGGGGWAVGECGVVVIALPSSSFLRWSLTMMN